MKSFIFVLVGCGLLAGCSTMRTDNGAKLREQDRAHVQATLAPERAFKPDGNQLFNREKNDQLAEFVNAMKTEAESPEKVRDKFDDLVEKKRDRFRQKVDKLRQAYSREETQRRENFLRAQKAKRQVFVSDHHTSDERSEFFSRQDQARQEFFADEHDRRDSFESELRSQENDFNDYMRERINGFNEQFRLYEKKIPSCKPSPNPVTGEAEQTLGPGN